MSIYWIVLFLVLLLIELATVNLVSIWFAIGSLAAFITLPIVRKFKSKEKIIPTNLDRVIGKEVDVVKEIKPNHYGEVEVFGTVWTATSKDTFKVGEKAKVVKMDGVKLIVEREERK